MSEHRRASDRYITPGVVMVGLVMGTVVVLSIVGVTGYLTARGYDPAPIVTLTTNLVGAAGALGTLIVQLVARKTQTRIERNTGLLPAQVEQVAAKVDDALWLDSQAAQDSQETKSMPPVPPAGKTRPHPLKMPRA